MSLLVLMTLIVAQSDAAPPPAAAAQGGEPAASEAANEGSLAPEVSAEQPPAAARESDAPPSAPKPDEVPLDLAPQQCTPALPQVPVVPLAEAPMPALLHPRRSGAALALGLVVGFGAGYYYAGEPKRGLMFSIADGVLILGLAASTVALNQLVISHDFASGTSLRRGERKFGKRERVLYDVSWALALAEVGSRVWQSIGSSRAAKRTNAMLQRLHVGPLVLDEGGLGAQVELRL